MSNPTSVNIKKNPTYALKITYQNRKNDFLRVISLELQQQQKSTSEEIFC
jgi:hypothetical protein